MSLTAEPQIRRLWYLGSPYSKYPGGVDEAFELVCRKAGDLMVKGYAIFCPIAHSHPIEKLSNTAKPHDFWLGQDMAFLDVCFGMFVYKMPSWEVSFGLNWEIDWMKRNGKPVEYIEWTAQIPKSLSA